MVKTVDAIFDGAVLRPTQPLDLEPNTHVRITVESLEEQPQPQSFLQVAQSLRVDGPADWSVNLDAYLYGTERDDEK